jgi:hypothetical protein
MFFPYLANSYNYIKIGFKLENHENDFIEKIFLSSTIKKAMILCQKEEKIKSINSLILLKIKNLFPSISNLYKLKTKYRNSICAVNIIRYIANLVNLIIAEKQFVDYIETIKYISLLSERILKNGKLFIPNWKTLIKQIDI